MDASSEEDVKTVVKAAVKRWGRLDVFFANAGIGGTNKRVWELEEKEGKVEGEFMRTMKVNALRLVLPFSFLCFLYCCVIPFQACCFPHLRLLISRSIIPRHTSPRLINS